MDELIKKLKTSGFDGIKFPEIRKSCLDSWGKDYAIVDGAYPDTFAIEMEWDGWETDSYLDKFENFLADFFGPGVTVNHRRKCQEIEVYPNKLAEMKVDEVVAAPPPFPPLCSDEKRIIPIRELSEKYEAIADLSIIFNHRVVEMVDGTWRWRKNKLMYKLYRDSRLVTQSSNETIDMNQLFLDMRRDVIGVHELMKFDMQTGGSLQYFSEVWGMSAADAKLPNTAGNESVIDYMVKHFAGIGIRV